MTKEEFLKMVERVLDELTEEQKKIKSTIEYYENVNPNGEEIKKANYQLQIVTQKITHIRTILELPMYARIQNMSEEEVEAYKNDKISEMRLKGVNITAELQQLQAEIERLKSKHEDIVTTFSTLDDSKREEAISQGKSIQQTINSKQIDFQQLQKDLEELKKEIENMQKKSSDDIKKQLTSEIGNAFYLEGAFRTIPELGDSEQLGATVGKDPVKAQQLAKLMVEYTALVDSQRRPTTRLDLPYDLPDLLRKKINSCYEYSNGEITDTSRLYLTYEDFVALYNKELSKFHSQFNIEKLRGLAGHQYDYSNTSPDLEFLKQHSDKLQKGELEDLQSYILQRDKLSKKIIKTKEVKNQIETLNNTIKNKVMCIYRTIIGWYQSYDTSLINVEKMWHFDTIEGIMEHLKRCEEFIKRTQDAMEKVKTELDNGKLSLSSQVEEQKKRREAIKDKMRELAGPGFEKSGVPYGSVKADDNLHMIANYVAMEHKNQVISNVLKEAQNQANMWQPNSNSLSQENVTEENIGGKTL